MRYDPTYLKVSCAHRKNPLNRNAGGGYLWIAALFSFLVALFVLYVYLCIFKLSHTKMSPTFRLTFKALDKVLPFQTFLRRESNTQDTFPCNQLNFFHLPLSHQPLPCGTSTRPSQRPRAGGPQRTGRGSVDLGDPVSQGAWHLRNKGEK